MTRLSAPGALLATCAALLSGAAEAAPDLALGRSIAEKTCHKCHQVDGASKDPQYPILAGQHAAYLAKQLRAFRAGERRNPLMEAVAGGLSEAEIESVAAYFAAQGCAPDKP